VPGDGHRADQESRHFVLPFKACQTPFHHELGCPLLETR
jgi:hypothetical protein